MLLSILAHSSQGRAAPQTAVTVESVDWFCGINNQLGCDQEAANFQNTLLGAPHTIWTKGPSYQDSNVFDTDFCDPDYTHYSYDNDTWNFDSASSAIAWFCGHGDCNDFPTGNACDSSSQCTTPPAGMSGPGFCASDGPPSGVYGVCIYNADRYLIVDPCNANDHHGGWIDYSNGGLVRWGESTVSGGWAGAATNGGNNFVVMTNSCALREEYMWQQIVNIFGGMQLLGTVMPTTYGSDSWSDTDRGTYTAETYWINPNASVGQAFLESQASMAQDEGQSCPCGGGLGCPNSSPNYTWGGGHGISGCGALAAISIDSTSAKAQFDESSRSWVQYATDSDDATGASWYWWGYLCNYDCNTFPINLP